MEEEDRASKAEAFLEAAKRTMDTVFQSHLVLPGDDATTEVCKLERLNPKLGGGLRQRESRITVMRAGSLRYKPPKTYWVESNGRRYIPKQEDQVLGIVEDRAGDYYRVNIFGASSALLPVLAFDGASKRNKPNLRTGALVFCRMSLADRHVEPELSCEAIGHAVKKDWTTGLNTFGELKGGRLARCSLMQARSLVKPSNCVLNEFGKALKFEIAVGANGLLWVNSPEFVHTTTILNTVVASEALDEEETKTMVSGVLENLQRQKQFDGSS